MRFILGFLLGLAAGFALTTMMAGREHAHSHEQHD
jgi:hypothetical protein